MSKNPTKKQIEEWKEIVSNIKPYNFHRSISCSHPKIYEFIIKTTQFLPINCTFSERVYCFMNNLTEKPKCVECDEKVNFIRYNTGYHKYCSCICSAKSNETKEKIKITSRKIYGTDYPIQNEIVKAASHFTWINKSKEEIEKIKESQKQTLLQNYGVENPPTIRRNKTQKRRNLYEKLWNTIWFFN